MKTRTACIGVLAVTAVVLAPETVAHPRQSQVTWTGDVGPIVAKRCVGCHRPNGFGPMPLSTYEEVRPWARAMAREVRELRMPPWPAAQGFGDFSNNRGLSAIEIELINVWAGGGTPLGPASTPAPAISASARGPDLVLRVPADPEPVKPVERVEMQTKLAGDRWITGWEFTPGNRSLIERAVLGISPGAPLGAWVPPDGPMMYPAGIAQRLPPGARVTIEIHYRKSAEPRSGTSALALFFGARPRHELRHQVVGCGTTPIDRPIDVLGVRPFAVEAGASLEVVARGADRTVEALAVIPRYHPGYSLTYRFRKAVRLSPGTLLDVRSEVAECGLDLDFVDVR